MNEQLQKEAMKLHTELYLLVLEAERPWDKQGNRRTVDAERVARLDRLARLSADRWRRRLGIAYRRVPEGVRGSRGGAS